MAENTDLRILYDGIEGKTSIDEKSGLNIKNDLIGVTKKLNDIKNRPRIIVDLDEIATSTALSTSLKKIINSLKIEPVKIKFDLSEIASQSKRNNNPVNTKIYDTDKLQRDQIKYITTVQKGQRMIDTIVSQLNHNGVNVGKVDLFANAKGSVKSFTVESIKANGAVEKLNFSLAKLKNGKTGNTYSGFVQNNLRTSDGSIKENEKYFKQQKANLDGILYGAEQGRNKVSNLNEIKIKYDEIEREITDLGNKSRAISDDERQNVKNLTSDLKLFISEVKKAENVKAPSQKATTPVVTPVVSQTKLQTFDADISKLEKIRDKSQELSSAFVELKRRRDALESNGTITTDNEILTAYREQYQLVTKLAGAEKTLGVESTRRSKKQLKNINDIAKAQALHDKKYSEAKKFGFNNSAFNKDSGLKSEYQSIMGGYDSLIGSKDIAAMDALNSKFDVFKRKVSEAGLLGQTFADKLSAQMHKLGVYFSAAGLMMGAFNQVKNMIRDVVELDGAMTELKKVTDETDATYSKFLDNAESRAKRLGSTLTDTITATADFARLGFNLSDSEKIADAALVYKNVGDGIKDVSQASESIISTMKAFGFEASHTMEIVDRFNKVGNNFAISSKDVGEGLKRSASALSVAGNSVDQSIALLVAGNNVVQDVDVVATALKTSALRLTNTKGKLEELGEDADGAAESITKLQTQILNLTKGKVDIMLNEDTFKSTYDIMLGMSKIWDSMNQKDQMTALDLMFGKRGANVGSSIITNMSDAEKVLSDSINSSGSALAENEKVLDSIQGKLSQFTAQYEALSNSVVNSELIKGVVDSGTGLLGTLTAIIDKVKILPTLITVAAGAMGGLTNKGGLKIKSSKMYLRPFAADGNIGQDQYEYGVLCLGAA